MQRDTPTIQTGQMKMLLVKWLHLLPPPSSANCFRALIPHDKSPPGPPHAKSVRPPLTALERVFLQTCGNAAVR